MADLTKVVCFRLPVWAIEGLKELAEEDKRSIGQMVRVIVERELEKKEEKK